MKFKSLAILGIIALGAFLRFYNLNWGAPFYFHPDERNIASSVSQLNFPIQMNPNFFAYGSFPIYLIYFTGFVLNLLLKPQDLFTQAIIISRFYSSILSLLLIPSVYFVGAKLHSKKVGLLAGVFCVFSVGFIQFAHFGTFEMWLTFLGIWFFYFSLRLAKDLKLKNIIITGMIFGLLMSIKVSSLPLLIVPVVIIITNLLVRIKIRKIHLLLLKISLKTFLLVFVSLITFAVFSPYVLLGFRSFSSSMRYEFSVALGTLPVFYTEEFFNSIPILFQFTKIYPFILNPLLTILFLISFIYVSVAGLRKKNYSYLILNACYLTLFLSQAFLFAKWTRYIIPTLPFMFIIISVFLNDLLKKSVPNIKYLALCTLILSSAIFSVSYFITAFVKPDTRIEASLWAKENIPNNPSALSEVYDMGIVPFNSYLENISLFNFYDLDQIRNTKSLEIKNLLSGSDYIILPSQRILKTRLLNQHKFPLGNKFYKNLINRELGYQKIYETPCDIFCKITYFGNPVFSFEETASVFERPTVFIFKKISY